MILRLRFRRLGVSGQEVGWETRDFPEELTSSCLVRDSTRHRSSRSLGGINVLFSSKISEYHK